MQTTSNRNRIFRKLHNTQRLAYSGQWSTTAFRRRLPTSKRRGIASLPVVELQPYSTSCEHLNLPCEVLRETGTWISKINRLTRRSGARFSTHLNRRWRYCGNPVENCGHCQKQGMS